MKDAWWNFSRFLDQHIDFGLVSGNTTFFLFGLIPVHYKPSLMGIEQIPITENGKPLESLGIDGPVTNPDSHWFPSISMCSHWKMGRVSMEVFSVETVHSIMDGYATVLVCVNIISQCFSLLFNLAILDYPKQIVDDTQFLSSFIRSPLGVNSLRNQANNQTKAARMGCLSFMVMPCNGIYQAFNLSIHVSRF